MGKGEEAWDPEANKDPKALAVGVIALGGGKPSGYGGDDG